MVFSNIVTPETLSSKNDISSGLKIVHVPPDDAAIKYKPHQTQKSPK